MRNLIKKILKEEDGWDWVRDIPLSIDKGYFTQEEEDGSSLAMAKKIMNDHSVTIEGSVDLMWENFPYDAENVFVWEIINPRVFNYEGVEYETDVDGRTGTLSILPTNNSRFEFFATPNYNDYGITPINYVVDDDYSNHSSDVTHPSFGNVNEMKDYFRNQYSDIVMGTILDFMDEHYNYSNIVE